jgi:hypothetical protein
MIQYSKYKRFYSNGDFTLNNDDYHGYVEVIDGIPCKDITRDILTAKQTFKCDFYTSPYFYDRLIGDVISLPNSLDKVTIQSNDFLTTSVIGNKLNNIHENNLFLYSKLFIADNDIPNPTKVTFLAPEGVNDVSLSVFTGFDSSVPFLQTDNFKQLGRINKFVTKKNYDIPNTYVLFGISSTEFITLSTNLVESAILETVNSSTRYETQRNELIFKGLSDITCNDTHIFITDAISNVIIKYEIEGYVNNDSVLLNKRNLIEIVGGEGNLNYKTRFISPTLLACNNANVVVFDSGRKCIKVFDTNFNYVTQLIGVAFGKETVIDIEFNNLNNCLYCLTQNSDKVLRLYVYDSDFELRESYVLDEQLEENEVVNNISFSYNDSNLWYFATNYYVYKKLVNRPEKLVGRFQTENIFTNVRNTEIVEDEELVNNIWNYTNIAWRNAGFTWNGSNMAVTNQTYDYFADGIIGDRFKNIYINNTTQNHDDIVLLSDCRLYFIKETSLYRSILKYSDFENYGKSSFSLQNDEYIQAATLNKELYKILYDLFTLKNNIVGRFSGYFDKEVPILTKSGYNYNFEFLTITNQSFIDNFLSKYNFNTLFINENEKNILGVVNRVLIAVYELQNTLLTLSQTDFGSDFMPVFNVEGTLIIE